jgi:hypothetical protein
MTALHCVIVHTQVVGPGKANAYSGVCETSGDRVSSDMRCILCGQDMAVASRDVSSRTI